nr:ribonuclease H-like domain-containing protein [Tanacetum cinerariifolium]
MLLMALPNEHLLTLSQYKDDKTLFEAIQARFGDNDATKKRQRTLLKQMYENFNAPSTKSLDSIFNKLQKVVSQLAIMGENNSQEDLNMKFLRSLSSEWNTHLALLSMRARRYFYRTGKKITINGSDTAGYDKTKVLIRATWLMMKFQPTWLLWLSQTQRIEFNKSEFDLATYKRGLASVEEQLVFYKKNEVMFCNQIAVLKRDASFRDSEINALNLQIEKLKKEKESNQIKIDNFKNASKSLDKLIGSQITNKSRTDTSNEINKAPDTPIIEDWVSDSDVDESEEVGDPQYALKDQEYFNCGCSRHMTGNISYPTVFKKHDGGRGYVAFGGGAKGGKITSKGIIITGKLDFEDVYFVKELQFNIFSVSHMCDKKHNVLFTDTECFVLSLNFKLADESQVLLKVPRKNNMYSFDMKNIVPQKDLTCLLAKATNDESML